MAKHMIKLSINIYLLQGTKLRDNTKYYIDLIHLIIIQVRFNHQSMICVQTFLIHKSLIKTCGILHKPSDIVH